MIVQYQLNIAKLTYTLTFIVVPLEVIEWYPVIAYSNY